VQEEVVEDQYAPHDWSHGEPHAIIEFAPPALAAAAHFIFLLERPAWVKPMATATEINFLHSFGVSRQKEMCSRVLMIGLLID
jgi:hypothetical protein